jgi:hypothetical protein
MRKTPVLLTGLLLVFTLALADKPETPSVTVKTHKLNLKIGDTADLVAEYVDSNDVEIDTTFEWSVVPDSLGPIDSLDIFTATNPGEGWIYVRLGDLADSIEITVRKPYVPPVEEDLPYLTVLPEDTVVTVGDTIQFSAWMHDSLGALLDAGDVTWSLIGAPIGTLSDTGSFVVTNAGYAFVQAANDSGYGNSLIVSELDADTTGANTIVITRENPSPQGYNEMATIKEGESWTIGGLPHPLNILNGGLLYFPQGSLHEDIRLHISLPDFAQIRGDSIDYGYGIVSGLEFEVMVNDTVVHPYTFDSPLFVALIFKRGLVRKMGIEPEDLTLSYVEIEGDTVSFNSVGIENVTVDSVRNRVFSNVAHFSSIALHESDNSPSSVDHKRGPLPLRFTLDAVYPNPFNPTATVTIHLRRASLLRVAVSDILGREVIVLTDSRYKAGRHQLTFDGSHLASGIYFIRASIPGERAQVQKALLLK